MCILINSKIKRILLLNRRFSWFKEYKTIQRTLCSLKDSIKNYLLSPKDEDIVYLKERRENRKR